MCYLHSEIQCKWDWVVLGVPSLWVQISRYIFMQCERGCRWSVGIRHEITHLIKINCSVSQELSVSHYLPHTTNVMAPHPHTALYTHACPKATCSLCAHMNACTRETRISSGFRREQIKAENQSDDICSNQQVDCSFSVWLNSACEKKELFSI